MTRETRQRRWRWLRHVAWVLAAKVLLIVLIAAGVAIFFGSGAGNPLIQEYVVRSLEKLTGGQVALKSISIRWLSLEITVKGLVIHGREPAGTEPLFAADEVQAGLRVDSFWGRKVSLNELLVQRPQVHIRVEKDGSSNIPSPQSTGTRKPARETLFDLRIRRLQLQNGWILYNDVRTPLAVEGNNLRLALDASGAATQPMYLGILDWQSIQFAAKRFCPWPVSVSAKFTLRRDGFTLEQGILNAGRSHVDAQAEMQDYARPKWKFRYRGWVNLLDLRENLRSVETPTGRADVHGEGGYAEGKLRNTGSYSGHDINLSYPIFTASGLASRGSFQMDNKGLVVPDFLALAFGGTVKGRVTMLFDGLKFRADTHVQDAHLAGVLPAIEHPGFPVDELHWDTLISADTTETWSGPFQHFEITGTMQWVSPDSVAAGHIPVDGDWEIRYRYDPETLTVNSGEFETPASRGTVSGVLAPRRTQMDVKFETGALESYRDFINALREAPANSADAIKVINGSARWEGTISGPSGGPTFAGHVRGEAVHYDDLAFDSLEGELSYSPDELTFSHAHIRRGPMDAVMDLALGLQEWSFLPDSTWSADVNLETTPMDALQRLLNTSYPVRGDLSGQFHGRGTRQAPGITGLFDVANGEAYGVTFNRLRGQLNLMPDEVRIANAELRLFPPEKEPSHGAGIVTGTAAYSFAERSASVDLVGASLPLANFQKLQSPRFGLDGQVSFRLKASGAPLAPTGEGTFRVVDLRVGQSVIGSVDGTLTSDGHTARLELGSAMSAGEISGGYTLALTDPYNIEGKVAVKSMSLDALILGALHLQSFSGHGNADGEIGLSGSLKKPESIVLDAKFSKLTFNYANVQLENVGPVHFRSSRDNLQIEPAQFRGPDTDIRVDGNVGFAEQANVSLRLNGALDLRLLQGISPGLTIGGPAEINAAFEGSTERPRITGRIHIDNANARVADFPTGLSGIKGDFIFDDTRLFFNDMTAQAGGGTLHLSGSVTYTERPLRYDITARSEGTRIRYPEGMSWLTGGSLRLTGTTEAGLLSGRVTVQRVTLTQGLEVAGVLVSSKEGINAPSTNSTFLRNLQFDVEAVSAPDARMEWPGAELDAEANIRVRGTWEHPILLGHIHVLSGDLLFHGNRYRVARGDINFANPFRLDPVVNVEASTTIQQYEITLNFNGQASKLTLAYRSDPPLPANDIVTLLALGQTSQESTLRSAAGAQSGTTGASALLSEAVSSQVGGRLEKLFGITNFRVDPGLTSVGSTGASQNAAARVTVQQQVTRNLTVTYVSNVGTTQQQVIQVEYNVNRNVSIVALRDYNGTFGIDVKIKKRFP
ncbi:MAG TPA: translocation/assembly module TamB domain-containing protein [Candidatus Acidoferrum sp.]|nr:translocation/assembly module TamB domain-containing protein [Candidatus Acidoferrum sp.]